MPNDLACKDIVLQGLGEVTLNKDFSRFIKIAKSKFHSITTTTNLMAKDTSLYNQYFDAGLTNLRISVDAIDDKIIKKNRPEISLSTIKKAILAIDKAHIDKVQVITVVHPENFGTLREIGEFISQLGITDWVIQKLVGYANDIENKLCHSDIEKAVSSLSNKLTIAIRGFNYVKRSEPFFCNSPFSTYFINADHYLMPCCHIWDHTKLDMGNLNNFSPNELINNAKAVAFRDTFNKGIIPEICLETKCPLVAEK
ncbi:MAG: hypothetical protein C0603_09785 [Denitrovibrio sp.]|nr:MAG: hypothetical protein C0603_09785 [Denitrovibrio sp.]